MPVLMFILVWIFTPTVFWPMIRELYGIGAGRIILSDVDAARLVRKWFICDWLRVVAIVVVFVASVRAISIPFPEAQNSGAAKVAN
jgi:hypothetical protein